MEKNWIGEEAAKLIKQDDIVFFDSGTTPLAIVNHIPNDLEFTAITTGLMTAIELCNKPKINVISIGGNIHCSSYTSVSHIAVDLIKRFNADIAFISTKAFSLPEGTYESLLPLIETTRAIVAASKKVILLIDHSKFNTKSLCLSIPLKDIDLIITDSNTPEQMIAEIKHLGKEIIVTK